METNNFIFQVFSKKHIEETTVLREGETKIGSTLSSLQEAKYVIIGVEESIGPRANFGRSGAENSFKAFISFFLNMQANQFFDGSKTHVLGKISYKNKIDSDLNGLVDELDNFIYNVLLKYIGKNQIPILIGGGHNNAYPLMWFSAHQYNKKLQIINLDAHADYRSLEGRHSGNSFSYAYNRGFIKKYHVIGLHEQYNNQTIIDQLKKDSHFFSFSEEYLFEGRKYEDDFQIFYENFSETEDYIGIELDLDTISNMPSSAFSPIGISIDIARKYLAKMGQLKRIAYLHLTEGAPNSAIEERIVGKTLAYLCSDFIKANSKI